MYNDTDDRRRYDDAGRRHRYEEPDEGRQDYEQEQAVQGGYGSLGYEPENHAYVEADDHRHYGHDPQYDEVPQGRSRLVPILTIVAAVLVIAIGVVAALYFFGVFDRGSGPASEVAGTPDQAPTLEATATEGDLGPTVRSVTPGDVPAPPGEEAPPADPEVPQAVVSIAPPTQGEPPVRSTHGDWQVRCDLPAGAQNEQCVLMQFVTAEDRDNVGLTVIVLKTADQKARIMRILAPLGVLLPSGLGLKIDQTDIGRAGFVRCLPNGCVAEVILEDSLLNQLQSGQTATFIIFQTPEEGIGIPISLAGFGPGFAALP
jgi:invasion protein IalB